MAWHPISSNSEQTRSGHQWRGMASVKNTDKQKQHLVTNGMVWRSVRNTERLSTETGVLIYVNEN